jgi:hypothetical protein
VVNRDAVGEGREGWETVDGGRRAEGLSRGLDARHEMIQYRVLWMGSDRGGVTGTDGPRPRTRYADPLYGRESWPSGNKPDVGRIRDSRSPVGVSI